MERKEKAAFAWGGPEDYFINSSIKTYSLANWLRRSAGKARDLIAKAVINHGAGASPRVQIKTQENFCLMKIIAPRYSTQLTINLMCDNLTGVDLTPPIQEVLQMNDLQVRFLGSSIRSACVCYKCTENLITSCTAWELWSATWKYVLGKQAV